MTELKTVTLRARDEFIEALDGLLTRMGWEGTRADYILEAVAEKAQRDGTPLPVAKASWGVRPDAAPIGWKSRLYKDRYQLVASYSDKGWSIKHLHQTKGVQVGPEQILHGETFDVFVLWVVLDDTIRPDLEAKVIDWLKFEG